MGKMDSEPARPKKTQEDKRPRDPARWIRRAIEKYRKQTIAPPLHPDGEFFALADEVVNDKRTLLSYDRLYVLWQAVRNVANLPGEVAEIGSYRGGSAHFIAKSFIRFTGHEVPIHIFDTFEGHPASAITPNDAYHSAGQFGGTNYDNVRALLAPFTQLTIHKGDVSASLPHLAGSRYRLVHIDTDLYQPTVVCLDYFGDRVCPGGVIVVDDYGAPKCPGVPQAVTEYLARTDQFHVRDVRTDQLLLIKR
jgi:O-methyltransferase